MEVSPDPDFIVYKGREKVLEEYISVYNTPTPEPKTKKKKTQKLSNLFEALQLESPLKKYMKPQKIPSTITDKNERRMHYKDAVLVNYLSSMKSNTDEVLRLESTRLTQKQLEDQKVLWVLHNLLDEIIGKVISRTEEMTVDMDQLKGIYFSIIMYMI